MGLLNENKIIMQYQAGIINESRFEALMKQLKSEKEASDKYEEEKEEMYGQLNEAGDPPGGPVVKPVVPGKVLIEGVSPEMMQKLMKQLSDEKEASDEYEKEKEDIYGLNEGVDPEVLKKLMSQIKKEKETSDQYEEDRKEFLQENYESEPFYDTADELERQMHYDLKNKLNFSDKEIEDADKKIKETESRFSDFLKDEYGDTPTPQETGIAIVNWAKNYMLGFNGEDFEGVSKYMNDEIWENIKYEISSSYMDDLRDYVRSSQGDIEEGVGIKTKDDIDTDMGGIEPSLTEAELNENKATEELKNILDDVMPSIIQSLPMMLKKADAKSKKPDGKIELTGEDPSQEEPTVNEQYLKEVLGLGIVAANAILAAPGIINLAGKFIKLLGSIPGMNINALKKTGELVSKFGSAWQNKYMKGIEVALKKVMPNASEKTIERASKAAFITIMATIAVSSGAVIGSGGESVHSAVNLGKDANALNTAKDLTLQLAKSDPSSWKTKLGSLLPFTLSKIFN